METESKNMARNGQESDEVRKVAPIRVVNLASLQDIKVVNREMPNRPNRRKSIHQVRSSSDEQMEFIESRQELSNDDNSTSTIASSSNSASATATTAFRKSFPSTSITSTMKKVSPKKNIGHETRPNENLMRRVALLRVCAEYMLKELNINNVELGENQSLEMLKAQYLRNSRSQQ